MQTERRSEKKQNNLVDDVIQVEALNQEVEKFNDFFRQDGRTRYMSDPDKVNPITLEEAQAAMELGIHIGIASWREEYHGSAKGYYLYSPIYNTELLQQLKRKYDADPFVRGYLSIDLIYDHENADISCADLRTMCRRVVEHKVIEELKKEGGNSRFPSEATTRRLRAVYPLGIRIQLEHMDDPYSPVPPGVKGAVVAVVAVDDAGQIHMRWDNGRSLCLIPGKDRFEIAREKHKRGKTAVRHTHAR